MTKNEVRSAVDFFHTLARMNDSQYYMQRAIEIAQYYSDKELV